MDEPRNAPTTWCTNDEYPGLLDFWRVYDAHYGEVTRQMQPLFAENPELAKASQDLPIVRARTHDLVREGVEGNWAPYEEHLRNTAQQYARVGLTFETWNLLTQVLGDVIAPRIVDAYIHDPTRLKAALRGMRRFLDVARVQLAKSFILEKETAREESAARKAAMLEAAIDAFVMVDHTGRIVEFNPAAVETFGYSREEAIGGELVDLLIAARRREAHLAIFRGLVDGTDTSKLGHRFEMMLRRSDGSEIPTELVITRISRDGPAMFTAFIRDVTMERRTREALAGSEQRLRNLAARLQEAIEEERTRIAREIHDELGQQLTALKLDLAWILRRYETGDRSAVDERLTAMANLVDATAETVRRLATGLRPGILDDLGVVPALEWQAREFETRTGICVDLTLPDDDDLDVPAEHATAFFRILQELLTNVTRHAKAKTVRICLEQDEGDLVLEVQDDGRGISAAETASGGSLGLVGMRERVGLLRGRIDFEGTPGAGTKVTTRVPLRVVASAR